MSIWRGSVFQWSCGYLTVVLIQPWQIVNLSFNPHVVLGYNDCECVFKSVLQIEWKVFSLIFCIFCVFWLQAVLQVWNCCGETNFRVYVWIHVGYCWYTVDCGLWFSEVFTLSNYTKNVWHGETEKDRDKLYLCG